MASTFTVFPPRLPRARRRFEDGFSDVVSANPCGSKGAAAAGELVRLVLESAAPSVGAEVVEARAASRPQVPGWTQCHLELDLDRGRAGGGDACCSLSMAVPRRLTPTRQSSEAVNLINVSSCSLSAHLPTSSDE